MVLKKLHILLIVVALAGAGLLFVVWQSNQPAHPTPSVSSKPAQTPSTPQESLIPKSPPAISSHPQTLSKPAPAPLHAAAPSVIPKTVAAAPSSTESYMVKKGDTLWSIALSHSPVRNGAGWVGVWKANKKQISNFNRLEVGWSIVIPQTARDYATPFWKPRASMLAYLPSRDLSVELSELPIAPESLVVDLRELPSTRIDTLDGTVDIAELPVEQDLPESEFTANAFRPPTLPFWGHSEYRSY